MSLYMCVTDRARESARERASHARGCIRVGVVLFLLQPTCPRPPRTKLGHVRKNCAPISSHKLSDREKERKGGVDRSTRERGEKERGGCRPKPKVILFGSLRVILRQQQHAQTFPFSKDLDLSFPPPPLARACLLLQGLSYLQLWRAG